MATRARGPLHRGALIVGAVVVLAGAFALGRLRADDGDDAAGRMLPHCSELAGRAVEDGPVGCLTAQGAALQGYRFECGATSEPPAADDPRGAGSTVTFIPDAGLVGATGEAWRRIGDGARLAAFHRTPFAMLGPDECTWLRSVPSDWPVRPGCDLDEVRIDLVSLQGCEIDGTYHPSVGRRCTYQDGDIRSSWEQWWLGGRAAGPEPALAVETAGPPETWTLIDPTHRDDRCRVPPRDWPQAWREP